MGLSIDDSEWPVNTHAPPALPASLPLACINVLHTFDPQVAVAVKARLPAMDGSQGITQPYFETLDGQPLRFTMGDTSRPITATSPANRNSGHVAKLSK